MVKESSTAKLIEYIQTLPAKEQRIIVETISTKTQKTKNTSSITEQAVMNNIKTGFLEIKEAKKTGKKLKNLDQFLNEI